MRGRGCQQTDDNDRCRPGIALTGDPKFDLFDAAYPYTKEKAMRELGYTGLAQVWPPLLVVCLPPLSPPLQAMASRAWNTWVSWVELADAATEKKRQSAQLVLSVLQCMRRKALHAGFRGWVEATNRYLDADKAAVTVKRMTRRWMRQRLWSCFVQWSRAARRQAEVACCWRRSA